MCDVPAACSKPFIANKRSTANVIADLHLEHYPLIGSQCNWRGVHASQLKKRHFRFTVHTTCWARTTSAPAPCPSDSCSPARPAPATHRAALAVASMIFREALSRWRCWPKDESRLGSPSSPAGCKRHTGGVTMLPLERLRRQVLHHPAGRERRTHLVGVRVV